MLLLFCRDPLKPNLPDDLFAAEASVADQLGIPHALIDHDAVVAGETERAIRRVPAQERIVTAVYRGWMVTAGQYASLHRPWNPGASAWSATQKPTATATTCRSPMRRSR